MPIDGPVETMDAAVRKLRSCDPTELRRARRHHRRALAALENGSYETLTGDTREQLVRRLRLDLEALERALDERRSDPTDEQAEDRGETSGDGSSGGSGWTQWLSAALW
jgi:hypothetical protein